MGTEKWTLKTLCTEAGVSPRTVRYYIQQGLLPPPERAGPGATYTTDHKVRLELIRRLKDQHLPLAEIRSRIVGLTEEAVQAMVNEASSTGPQSAADYVRSVLEGNHLSAHPSPAGASAEKSGNIRGSSRVSSAPPPQQPRRSTWERHSLTEDIELHIRRPLSRSRDKQVRVLLNMARNILYKDSE